MDRAVREKAAADFCDTVICTDDAEKAAMELNALIDKA